jgi:hypothetical protein
MTLKLTVMGSPATAAAGDNERDPTTTHILVTLGV